MTALAAEKWGKFKPIKGSVKAFKHAGTAPRTVNTEHGTEDAQPGDYVVEVGTHQRNHIVPPKDGKPGYTELVEEPAYEVMKAEDFEALYEPA